MKYIVLTLFFFCTLILFQGMSVWNNAASAQSDRSYKKQEYQSYQDRLKARQERLKSRNRAYKPVKRSSSYKPSNTPAVEEPKKTVTKQLQHIKPKKIKKRTVRQKMIKAQNGIFPEFVRPAVPPAPPITPSNMKAVYQWRSNYNALVNKARSEYKQQKRAWEKEKEEND